MQLAIVTQRATETNLALAAAAPRGVRSCLVSPAQAVAALRQGDAALGRLDVLRTLDGVDDGLWALGSLAARGVPMLNRAGALLAAHDKLLTARLLRHAGLPHPRTRLLSPGSGLPELRLPVVLKPRFGSWGIDVVRCDDDAGLHHALRELERRPWFRSHGALVQDLVPPQGSDLRIVVAGGSVVGAIERVAAPGEWRTNVALGGRRRRVDPPAFACMLAREAASAAGADLVGVDLLPDGEGGWVVLELNGAVEFTLEYGLDRDPFAAAAAELARVALGQAVAGGGSREAFVGLADAASPSTSEG
ncbi:MAG: [lysine-biosynthesis-protein LysW]---L-2-aminoadipate ligase [Gaiellaceae bacterium]|nr:[lysine-biosynthesis-protein LysW]---L-2-aminoadipate ligase [Gaiellaceae bacterium]